MRVTSRRLTSHWHRIVPVILAVGIATLVVALSAGAFESGDTLGATPPTFTFVQDTGGVGDAPNQRDLTAHANPVTNADGYWVAWKWDDTLFSGTNTGDACALFNTDTDQNVNAALCVTINTPTGVNGARHVSTRVYTCGDSKNDRCTSSVQKAGTLGSKCRINDAASPTFPTDGPSDTQATCRVDRTGDFGTATAALLNTCSYPSQQPNSAPADCVLVPGVVEKGAIEITKTGDDARCTAVDTPNPNCTGAGTAVLSGAVFEITGTGVPGGTSGDLTTDADGKACFANLPTGGSYTVTEKTPPPGYAIDEAPKSISVGSAGDCTSGATKATATFTDSPVSTFQVIFTPPADGVTEAQISCDVPADTENNDPDNDTTPVRDDTDETYSDLPAGTYNCTIDIAQP
jgi:hypothetical protein